MSVIQVVKNYVVKMITESEPGYKIMLMDKETTSFVSVVLGMSEVMRQEVYMFERLDQTSSGENMSYLKCLVYVRPTRENIELLVRELQKPRYGNYYIYFSNVVSKSDVKLLAEADEQEVVREVQELYADYQALSPHLFSLNMPTHSQGLKWANGALPRTVQGVAAVLFSLQVLPSIRYQNNSEMARVLAENIRQTILNESSLYNSPDAEGNTLLLILDRRDDPVTPLLHQWTYEAMVHELLGVTSGRVSLAHVAGVADDLKEVVMSPAQDDFYAQSRSVVCAGEVCGCRIGFIHSIVICVFNFVLEVYFTMTTETETKPVEQTEEKKEEVKEEVKKEEAETNNAEEKADDKAEKADKEKKEEEKKDVKAKKEPAAPKPAVHKLDFEKDVVYLYQFTRTPVLPSLSPYCLKVETWLRLAGLKYENVDHKMKYKSKKGQLPFVEVNGEEIADSAIVIKELGSRYNTDLDASLTTEQRNVAHATISMIENHFAWVVKWWRCRCPGEWVRAAKLNLQQALNTRIPNAVLNFAFKLRYRQAAKKVRAHGIGVHKPEEIEEFGHNDLMVLSDLLGDKPFFFGDAPTTLDVVAFANLAQVAFMDKEVSYSLRDWMTENCANLVEFCNRVKERAFPDWDEMCTTLDLNSHLPKPPPEEKVEEPATEKKEEKTKEEEKKDEKEKDDTEKEKAQKDEKEGEKEDNKKTEEKEKEEEKK